MSPTHHIGLEIGQGVFRLVEIRRRNGTPSILGLGEYATEHDFGSGLLHDVPFTESLAKSFLRDLAQLLRRQKLFSSTLSLAIPASVPFVATLPVDCRLDPAQQREQLEWECAQHFPRAQGAELAIFTHVLKENCDAHITLTVALPASTVQFLRKSCALMTLHLQVIDVDHFMVEHAVRQTTGAEEFALLGLHAGHFSLSLQEGSTYAGFRLGALDFTLQHLSPVLHALQLLLAQTPSGRVERMYVFGTSCTEPVLYSLRSLLQIEVAAYDPFSTLRVLEPARGAQAMGMAPASAGAACGAALRWA